METQKGYGNKGYYNKVLTVPMRNGNAIDDDEAEELEQVLTVPMRNGNNGMMMFHYHSSTVLTVPMRNGN